MNILLFFSLFLFISCLVPEKDFRPNVFVLTDISNEPDDAESLVRLLLYSNEVSILGLVATTSYWLNYTTHEEDIYPILDAYESVRPQLLKHSAGYPSAEYLRSIVSSGYDEYGLNAFKRPEISAGARLLIDQVDKSDDTVFVLVWGGAAVLAEALKEVTTRLEEELAEFIDKLFVYSISDQDNAGAWMRTRFPSLRYIASIHGYNQYGLATWVGISGEKYNHFDYGGPDSSLVSFEWLKKNIQDVGPLGAAYPTYMFNMEGDTPSTLYVLPNGLGDPFNPHYGSWGGRYILVDLSGALALYSDTTDYAIGQDDRLHVSNYASIWRWREAYQYDFAVRMQWTVKEFKDAVHQPVVVVNGSDSVRPYVLEVPGSTKIVLDASKSHDLNGRKLTYKWWHYREVTVTQSNIVEILEIEITNENEEGSIVSLTSPPFTQACHNAFGRPLDKCREYHIILEVTNDGDLPAKAYRRIVLQAVMGDDTFEEVVWEQSFDQNFQEEEAEAVHDEL